MASSAKEAKNILYCIFVYFDSFIVTYFEIFISLSKYVVCSDVILINFIEIRNTYFAIKNHC